MLKWYKNTFQTVLAFFSFSFISLSYLVTKKTTLQAKYYCKLFSFQQDDPQKRRSSQRPQYSGKKCDLVTPKNTWTALKNSSGRVCDPRCEEVLVLEEMGRKDKIQQKFNPHKVLGWFSNRNRNVSWRRRAQIKQLAWPMAERQIGHRKSCLFLSTHFPVINWHFCLVAKSAYWCQDLDLCPMLVQCSKLNFLTVFWFSNTE